MKQLKLLKLYDPHMFNDDLKQFKYGKIDGKNKVPIGIFTDLSNSFKMDTLYLFLHCIYISDCCMKVNVCLNFS